MELTPANQTDHEEEFDTKVEGLIPQDKLSRLFCKSCSQPNFVVNLVRKLFSEKVKKVSNVSGKRKKNWTKKKWLISKPLCFGFILVLNLKKI